MINLIDTLNFTIQLALKTGSLLKTGFQQAKTIQYKSSAIDPVTQFDQAAEALIVERIQTAFPTHYIVAEEGGNKEGSSPYRWYVDPLDGTVNFAHGFPHFSVSLALYREDTPLVGVVYDPMRDELFYAAAGQGAHCRCGTKEEILRVSQTNTLLRSLLATGYPYDKHTSAVDNLHETAVMLKQIQGLRRAGSAALDLAYTAAGRLDGYWEYKLNSWDAAAGVLLVQEADGIITTIDGSPFAIAPVCNLVASNGRIHQNIAAALQSCR